MRAFSRRHGVWHPIEPGLHPVEHRLMLPALVPFDLVECALGFQPATRACREVAVALSGLAQAFIYAGARSLVVSHWDVNDAAAVKIIGAMFAISSRLRTH
jgi:hypothetical protein